LLGTISQLLGIVVAVLNTYSVPWNHHWTNHHGTTIALCSALEKVSRSETIKGISLERHKYPEEGHHIVIAWQVLRHDESSNQNWSKSTIDDKISVCVAAKLRAQGR
jgi:hypothetical protein